MKKIILAGLITGLLINTAFASQQIVASKRSSFAPQSWTSQNSADIIAIQNGLSDLSIFTVQIYVSKSISVDGTQFTGVNVKNCGSVTHINPGSSAICQLEHNNPVISFSSDKDNTPASGVYQVEQP